MHENVILGASKREKIQQLLFYYNSVTKTHFEMVLLGASSNTHPLELREKKNPVFLMNL